MFIETETTPNPATLKFLPGRMVMPEGTLEIRDRQAGLKQEHEAALKAYKDYQNELIPARIKTDSWGDSQRRRSVHQFLNWESDLGSWGWRRRSR